MENSTTIIKAKIAFLNKEFKKLIKLYHDRLNILRYNVSHDHITESLLNDIIKISIKYILHRRQSQYGTDSDRDSDDDEPEEKSIDNNLQSMINNISEEKSISNNLKQLLINNLLKQSEINKILKYSTINNKEYLINDILNEKTINNEKNS